MASHLSASAVVHGFVVKVSQRFAWCSALGALPRARLTQYCEYDMYPLETKGEVMAKSRRSPPAVRRGPWRKRRKVAL